VVEAMRELDLDLSAVKPQLLTKDLIEDAVLLVTMGCGESCPIVPGMRREDWPLADPKGDVREIRDQIRTRVWRLLVTEGWSKLRASPLEAP